MRTPKYERNFNSQEKGIPIRKPERAWGRRQKRGGGSSGRGRGRRGVGEAASEQIL